MKLPDRPDDFSDEEYAELCELQEKIGDSGVANPHYVRVGRKFTTVTVMHPKVFYDPSLKPRKPYQ